MATDRPEVDRRGTLVVEAVVPCRCILMFLEVEDWRECDEEEMREGGLFVGKEAGDAAELREEFGGVGRMVEEMVREC